MIVESMWNKFLSKIVNNIIIFIRLECLIFKGFTLKCGRFSSHTLYKHTNSHSWWKSIRINNNIRSHTSLSKRHINFRPQHWKYTFLTMAWWKFISDYRSTIKSKLNCNSLCIFIISWIYYNTLDITSLWLFIVELFKLVFGCIIEN